MVDDSKALEVLHHLEKNLNIAVSEGDVQTIQRLLKDGADVNYKDIDGRTPLHYSINSGHIDVVNILLKHGADVTQITNKGNTPLHTATNKGYQDIVEVLLQHVSRDKVNDFINARTTSNGTTSLHIAAKSGFLDIVKSLLKHGATYNIENKDGKTPFNLSKDTKVTRFLKLVEELFEDTKYDSVEIMNKFRVLKQDDLLAVTSTHNNQGHTILEVGQHIADNLLEILKEPDQGKLPFSSECELNELKKLKDYTQQHFDFTKIKLQLLISHPYEGVKNNNPWKTVKEGSHYLRDVYHLVKFYKKEVRSSIDSNSIQLVNDILVALEFNPKHLSSGFTDEAYGGEASCFISKGQGTKYYKLLHSEFSKDVRLFIDMVELNIEIPLRRFLEAVKERLESAFSENLLEAIKNNNLLGVKNFIKEMDVNFKDTEGRTPLHHAVNNGNIDIVRMLLENGAKVVQITNKGYTPLHIASSKGYREVIEVLLQHVSRSELVNFINAKTTSDGAASLHIAAKNGFLGIAKSLLKHGATYNIENNEFKTPIILSRDPNSTKFLKLVEESFEETKKGNVEIINKLRVLTQDDFLAVTSARNNQGNTLLQVAMANKHKKIADELLKI